MSLIKATYSKGTEAVPSLLKVTWMAVKCQMSNMTRSEVRNLQMGGTLSNFIMRVNMRQLLVVLRFLIYTIKFKMYCSTGVFVVYLFLVYDQISHSKNIIFAMIIT